MPMLARSDIDSDWLEPVMRGRMSQIKPKDLQRGARPCS